MRCSLCVLVVALAACGKPPYHDVVGPFTGTTYRFAVNQLLLPMWKTDFADDLNGDGRGDNQLGEVVATLAGNGDLTTAVDDMLASGALAPVIEITTDDPALRDDPTVGVRFFGADGEPAAELAGTLANGVLTTNPTRLTRAPASATVHLPLFRYADPLPLPAIGLELDLVADGAGFGGALRGGFVTPSCVKPAWTGLTQMVTAAPQDFQYTIYLFDADGDGTVSFDEFARNGLLENLIASDIQLTDGNGGWAPSPKNMAKDSLSFAVGLHLVPCAAGSCHAPPADACDDRVLDGDETDVDCGGSCMPCPVAAGCRVDADCQTRCDGGRCAAPTCSDGVRDGGEPDVDCGGSCGVSCPSGDACRRDGDCTSGYCASEVFQVPRCTDTRCDDGVRDNDESDVDCGGHCPACARGQLCRYDSECASHKCEDVTCSGIGCTPSGTCG